MLEENVNNEAIVEWLGAHDTGASSKVIALTALGRMPDDAKHKHPHDGDDFGRCYRLLKKAPAARAALDKLAQDGGPYWKALVANWPALEAAYDQASEKGYDQLYAQMRAILYPIEKQDRTVVRLGPGVTMRFGR